MVFLRKGATPSRNAQVKKGKKTFEKKGNDSEFENDSDIEMPVQKTPQNKMPKGRNSMSEKKVSFELPGKRTPGKTPQKNNSLLAKRQLTPAGKGKIAVPEFKGIKGSKAIKKKALHDEEDDSEIDLDFDMEDDEEDEGDDVEEEDVDEEEEDDDEDEEGDDGDEEEEDDGDEELKAMQTQKKYNAKHQKNDANKLKKIPVKDAQNSKQLHTPKVITPRKEIKKDNSKETIQATLQADTESKREKDLKSLYVGNLHMNVTTEELKALAPDVQNVFILKPKNSNFKKYAILEFVSEDEAESNYQTLQGKKLRNQLLKIDFFGEKSKNISGKLNLTKLYVSGIPYDASLADVAIHFPKAFEISLNASTLFRSAIISFEEKKSAGEALNSNVEINGKMLSIVYCLAKKSKKHNRKKSKNSDDQGGNPRKRMKSSN
ncbi:RRM domain-containing protein [Nephila pilipes]|uniref:RRM domain-containing protein n=1 Tax=Nephila pilipes TaxID=299642 RepID=A0A8X6Q4Z6_NEPPI|nr:RRM domain-containing protein [Nephila pilipes]